MSVRPGVRLGLDWGQARIGVAACDPRGVLAYPVETVRAGAQAYARLVELVGEYEPIEVVIGLPRSLTGGEGPAATRIREHAQRFAEGISPIQVRLLDERFTTVSAERTLRQLGKKAKQQRSVIDQVAAVTILNQALESERSSGEPPGQALSVDPGEQTR